MLSAGRTNIGKLSLGVIALAVVSGSAQSVPQEPNAQPNPYDTIRNHFQMPQGRTMGSTGTVKIDPDGRSLWMIEKCGSNVCAASNLSSVLKFDASGRFIKGFGEGMFIFPHGLWVDRDGSVWAVDGQGPDGQDPNRNGKGHQVVKFSSDGKVLLRLGTPGVSGTTRETFNQPSDVLVAPSGDVFVADGHGGASNARIVKFSRDGKYVTEWGKPGVKAGEFDAPHGLAMDSRGRLFVADRGNSRIQIFDQQGTFLEEWKQFGRPSGLFIDANDVLYVADSTSNERTNPGWKMGIRIGSARDGRVTAFIPDPNPEGSGEEGVAADREGIVYGAQTFGRALNKYVRR